jgi:CheY-like chemotaxis protein
MTDRQPDRRHVVLLVEDEPDIREALHTVLHQESCEVLLAGDGREALRLLRRRIEEKNQVPCAILLDLWMPGMSGDEFLAKLAAAPEFSRIPVVVLTGAPGEHPRQRWPQVRQVITKPFRLEAVFEAIQPSCESCSDALIRK